MRNKALILLLAISMVCSSLLAVFATNDDFQTEGSKQDLTNINNENAQASIDEPEKNNEKGKDSSVGAISSEGDENQPENTLLKSPQQNNQGEKNYKAKVTFVGQWVAKSSKKEDSVKEFNSPEDKIGKPIYNEGLLRGLAKNFLGWSDKPPINNGHLAEGARYFSPEDSIETAFPNGIPEDAKLYGVYFSLLDEDEPLKSDLDITAINKFGNKFKTLINDNKVTVNSSVNAEETRPDTINNNEKVEGNERIMQDHYKNNVNNEVVLTSEFSMDPTIALITYKNPVGSSQLRPIFSRDYNTRKSENGEFNTSDGTEAGYTYVDLNVNLDDQFQIPEVFYMEYFGYSWRPLYVMDENKNKLEILNPNTDESLGNDKNSFNSLVNNSNPTVRFGIKPNGASKITVRVILRESNEEKILEKNVTPDKGKTIMETVLKNMTLKFLSREEIKNIRTDLQDDELDNRILGISDKKARELAKTGGEERLNVNGNIKGHVFVNAGEIKKGFFKIKLKSESEIQKVESNNLQLGYIPNNVYYKFVSDNEDKNLPDEIIAKLPENITDALDQDKINLSTYDDVKVDGGVWRFKSWYITNDEFEKDTNPKEVSQEATLTSPDDLYLLGVWEFKNDETSTPEPMPTPNEDENKTNIKKSPQTSDNQSIYLSLMLTLASLTSIVILQEKRKKEK